MFRQILVSSVVALGMVGTFHPTAAAKAPRYLICEVKEWGDVIGMTAAHEADLCSELELRYNSLALIDNYANGLEGTDIDFVKFKELVKHNQARVNRLFVRLLEILG